ncbi:MAG TPA: hypothetical protein VHA13_03665 [Gammaproteobacteria bacterium]|nr:hypothetical protein [Gammaproteobacteria bacterium]
MALSESQQVLNQSELLVIFENPALAEKPNLFELQTIVAKVCSENNIVLNSQQESIQQLITIINNATDYYLGFQKEVEAWAKVYKQKEAEAALRNQALFAAQARGIYRGLADKQLQMQAWCEDIDFEKALPTIHAEKITSSGTYIVKPKDLSSAESLSDTISTVLKNNLHGNIKLLIPVAYAGHWRLAKIELKPGKISAASLWDSFRNDNLSSHQAFINMQQALNNAQPESFVPVTPDPRGIQENSWSCGDYVMQECCRELTIQNALNRAKEPQELRLALVQQIKRNNPELRQVLVSARDQGLFAHLEKNTEAQLEFDEKMAHTLNDLYRDNPDEMDEDKLVQQARDKTYEVLKLRGKS